MVSLEAAADPNQVFLSVSDTGIGIAEHDLQRAFEPFIQVHDRSMHPLGGSGLGLALARQYARRMGGDLVVQSHPGRGSRFTLSLPIHT